MEFILKQFGFDAKQFEIEKFGSGHINNTFLLISSSGNFILQKINIFVFKNPDIIAENVSRTSEYLNCKHPEYLFIHCLKTISGEELLEHNGEFWRISPFVENSYSINILEDPTMAQEAAAAFGKLTKNLHGMPTDGLKPSIEGFHDLAWRFEQFLEAETNCSSERKSIAKEQIDFYIQHKYLVETYLDIVKNPNYPVRMMHHDTKINNVLFDKNTNESIAVCDLDTLMPGRIISDLGDMVRTYTSPESEESVDFEHVVVRDAYFEALIKGYLGELKTLLTDAEKHSLIFAGPFMIYMQGLRFLADFLNNDVYYPTKYPEHNLNRAINQRVLLEDYFGKEGGFQLLIENILNSN